MARPIQTTYVVQMGLLKDGEVFGSPFLFKKQYVLFMCVLVGDEQRRYTQ